MTTPDIVAQWRQAAEANEELARTETDPVRLTQHVEAARYCRDMVADLERGTEESQ